MLPFSVRPSSNNSTTASINSANARYNPKAKNYDSRSLVDRVRSNKRKWFLAFLVATYILLMVIFRVNKVLLQPAKSVPVQPASQIETSPSKFNPRPDRKSVNVVPKDLPTDQIPIVPVPSKWILTMSSNRPANEDTQMTQTVKNMMKHAWGSYVKYAWGYDELQPLTKSGRNWLNGDSIGATIIDSLDTLWIMEMFDEFDKAREWVLNKLDFNIDADVSVFETNIRVVGGLLSAYELSGDMQFVKKATEVADRLLPAFNTATGIPDGVVNLHTGRSRWQSWSNGAILAEYGSMQLEFQYLSEITGDKKYATAAFKALDYVTKMKKSTPGLYHTTINNREGNWHIGTYTVGALSDSFYEYLLKVWLMNDRQSPNSRKLYDESARAIKKYLIRKTPNGDLYLGVGTESQVSKDMEHLACFAGGMYALGAISNQIEPDWIEMFEVGANLTKTCYKMYSSQPLGIGAEKTDVISWQPLVNYYILRPEVIESIFYMWRLTHDEMYRDWGRQIVKSIEKWCKTDSGYAGIVNIKANPPVYNNNQESFFLAETLKYLYLMFTDDSVIPLDEFVFNTEAHPFRTLRNRNRP